MDTFWVLLSSFGASACFALLFNAPRRSILPAAFTGLVGYGVYLAVKRWVGSEVGANLAAALVIAGLGEVFARRMHMPATIFISVGVITLVPGVGLYQTMLAMVQNRYSDAAARGVETLLIAGAIALAVALVAGVTRMLAMRRMARKP